MASTLSQPWLTWALLSATFAALTAIFAKLGVDGVSPDMATFLRTLFVVAALCVLLAATGQFQSVARLDARTWLFLGLSGFATGASWLCYFRALQVGQASHVAPVDKLSVVLVAILGVLFLGESLSLRQWLGVGLMGTGGVLVALR